MRKYKYKNITYSLKRSDRKTMSIYVERDGTISVLAPINLSIDKLNKIIELKSFWIHKSLAQLEELNKTKVKRELVSGEGYLYLGRAYRLKIEKNLEVPLSLKQGYFLLDENHIEKAKKHFVDFYREKGKKHIPARIEYFKDKLGVNPDFIKIMDLQNRWASRSNNSLNFHWKVMLAPLTIIDYIVVHELVHFIKPDHSLEYWSIVESVIPDYSERKNWLKISGANLDI